MLKTVSVVLLFFLLAVSPGASLPVRLSDQGTEAKNNGTTIVSGNLTILIFDSATGGNVVFNQTFPNNITNGTWNVMIEPDLEFGRAYFKDYQINGVDLDFDGVERLKFNSPLGFFNNRSLFNFSMISSCPSGQAIQSVAQNGSVSCVTTAGGGGNITGSGIADRIAFWTNASNLGSDAELVWNNTAKVFGIGGFPASDTHLYIEKTDPKIFLTDGNASSGNRLGISVLSSLNRSSVGTVNAIPLILRTNDVERVTIDASGKVGIGTITPGAQLHIIGGFSQQIWERTGVGKYQFAIQASGELSLKDINGTNNLLPFRLQPNTPSNTLFLKNNGNVGINTSKPTRALDVAGQARIRGLTNCDTIDTDANGNLACGTDAGTTTSFEFKSATCGTFLCTATASCSPGFKIYLSGGSTSDQSCSAYQLFVQGNRACNANTQSCLGQTSCSVTSSSSFGASVMILCMKVA